MTVQSKLSEDTLAASRRRALLLRLVRERHAAATPGSPGVATPAALEPDLTRRNEPFPLTEIQQAYWIGRSSAYAFGDVSIHAYVEVEGVEVDLRSLERSWRQLVTRHDMLRAVVLPDGRQQVLADVPPYLLRTVDLRGCDRADVNAELGAAREEMSHQVLDAETWPGFDVRATLLDGGRTRVHISIDLLHIDGGSLMILVDEWMQLYRDENVALPVLEVSYRDYVLAELALHDTEGYLQSAKYWHDRVATLPAAPALPVRAGTSHAGPSRFRRRHATLDALTWQALKERAAAAGLTPSAVLLAAYAEVLGCWSDDDAFTLNVTLFNRLPLHPQVNRILGDFTSMILLEVAPRPGVSFAGRATATQKDLWAGLNHRHVSGIQVLRELARAQGRSGGAPMPVVFTSMLDLAAAGFRPPFASLGAIGEVVYSVTQTPQVWLDHQVMEEEGALMLTWDAVEDLFPVGLLDDMFAAYERFLRSLAKDGSAWSESTREHVPLEQIALRDRANDTGVPVPDETLLSLFLRQAHLRPDSPAVITSARELSYADVLGRATRLGHALRAKGAQPDTLVAVVMEKGWEQVVATLGIHLAGAAYLPVDPGLPTERRNLLLRDGQVRLAVTQPWLDVGPDWPAGVERICVDDELDAASSSSSSSSSDTPLVPVQGSAHLSHVIYTSGSTGVPKGVMIEHRQVVNRLLDVNQRLGIGPSDRVLALTPLHHDLSVYDIFGVLAAGGALVMPDAAGIRDPRHWAELMVRAEVTVWNSVPAFLQMLLEYLEAHAEEKQLLPRGLRHAVLSGDWVPVGLPDRLRALAGGVQVMTCGGPTETTIWDICYPVTSVDPAWPSIPYGKPMNNAHYYVLDRALQPCPVWTTGQLHIGGAGLARGYWRDEAKTQERFITHPETGERLFRSGDLGRYLPDGNIEFVGRADHQVKISGQRIELGEIEATLTKHPAVGTAVVTAVGDPRQLQRLVAYVVPLEGRAGPDQSTPAGEGMPATAGDGKTVADFEQRHLEGISVLDPVARIEFKLHQWGVRRDTQEGSIAFRHEDPDESMLQAYAGRRSVHSFLAGPLPSLAVGELLRSLTQIEWGGLTKYRYPSGGGLYPVQTYVFVKPDRIDGIPGGVYYHDPKNHRLLLMSPGAVVDAGTQLPHNRVMFDQAAFVIFLVGQLAAVEPLYGHLARDFCLLEAGYMSQLLMTLAPEHGIGLCPVGAMDFEPVRRFFGLDDTHALVHLIFAGPTEDDLQPAAADKPQAQPGESAAPAGPDLVTELRAFLRRKLPEQMQPSAFVVLDKLPLTSNGKVDRRRLPAPDAVRVPAQLPDRPPRNDAERRLAVIAERILPTERLGIHQNFFELGGTSVHMVQILNKVRAEFGREVPVTEIFRHPTVSSLAAYLSEEKENEPMLTDSDERASQRRASLAERGARRRGRRQPDVEGTGRP